MVVSGPIRRWLDAVASFHVLRVQVLKSTMHLLHNARETQQ